MTPIRTGRVMHLLLVAMVAVTGCKKKQPPPPPPPEVEVISVTPTNVPLFDEWIGTLDGFVNAQIRAEVTGYLLSQNYSEGGEVKKGDLLFQIDPRPFQAALDQAQSRLNQDKAQQVKTGQDVQRYTPLAKDQAISQEQLDNAVQANAAAQAQIKADEAAIETARLNLGFTRVTSPIDGLAGTALAQIGDLVGPSSGILTTVSTVNPIKVYFQVSEDSYLTFWRQFIGTIGHTNMSEGPALELILSDGTVYPKKGKFFFADRQVNIQTGTLQIAGLFPNDDALLRPGQYARIRTQTHEVKDAIVVPQRAVTELQNAYQVAIVGESNRVHVQTVKVGPQVGENWLIESGLKAGEQIVVEGLQKAREGSVVAPKPYQAQVAPSHG